MTRMIYDENVKHYTKDIDNNEINNNDNKNSRDLRIVLTWKVHPVEICIS